MSLQPILNKKSDLLLGGGILALSLFSFLPDSYGLMVQWPWVVLWQLGMLAIAFWTLWQLRLDRTFELLGHGFDLAIALSLFSLLLSTLFSYQLQPSTWYLVMAGGWGITLYALNIWLHRDTDTSLKRRWLLRWLGICAVLSSAVSLIFLWLNRNALAASPEQVNPYPLGHHNFVAGYLVLVLPLLVALAWVGKSFWRWFWGIGALMAIAALYTTGSRGGQLGFLSLVLAIVVVFLKTRPDRRSRLVALFSGLAVLGGAIALAISNPRVQRLIASVLAGRIEGNAQFRLFTIEAGLHLWRDYPWLGIGPGNTIKLYDLYRPIEAGNVAFRVQQVHCTPVELLVELGIFGFAVYLLWMALIALLAWRLWRSKADEREAGKIPATDNSDANGGSRDDRPYFLACIAGLFAYTISSLTDYQLENLPISLTLVGFIAILISFADRAKTRFIRSSALRRSLSLMGFALVLAALPVWIPVDAAMMLAREGTASLQRRDIPAFYDQWSKAAKLVPTDPYYQFQIGAQLTQLIESNFSQAIANNETIAKYRQQLLERARTSLTRAVELVPTDELFNRYLGAFYVQSEPQQATTLLRRAAQLTPRKSYTYAMLGDAYLRQQNESAKDAFALEGLINPVFLTVPAWGDPAVQNIWSQTLKQAIGLYREVIAKMSPTQPEYNPIYQNMVMLQWWAGELPAGAETSKVEMQRLNPTAQALLLIDAKNTKLALERLSGEDPAAMLLKAWIAPERYLVQASRGANGALTQTIPAYQQQLRSWLVSLPSQTKAISGRIGFFSYRNTNGPDRVELPRSLPTNPIVNNLSLFTEIGTLPVFDQTLVAAQKRLLNLDRPLTSKSSAR